MANTGDEKCPWIYRNKYDDYFCNSIEQKVDRDRYYFRYCTSLWYDDCPFYKKCYVATLVCNELGITNTKETLDTLYYLKHAIMENNEQYKETLQTYDTVGPAIVEKLGEPYIVSNGEEQVDTRPQIFRNLYNLCMVPVKEKVEQGNQDDAIRIYKDTMNLLIQGYNQQTDEKGKIILFK